MSMFNGNAKFPVPEVVIQEVCADKITLKVGEQALAFYRAENTSNQTITGTAVFNVSPPLAGKHFDKVEGFLFPDSA